MYFVRCLGAAALALVALNAGAVTAVVDGVGPDTNSAGPFKTLWAAVQYTNAAGAGPHTIDIIADSSVAADNNQTVLITNAVTINGDADGDHVPFDILVDVPTIRNASVVGQGERAYLKVMSEGDVVINDLRIHPNARGNSATIVDPIHTYNPSAGTGNYALNNVWISTSATSANPTFVDPLTESDILNIPNLLQSVVWYGYLDASGIFYIADGTGSGTSNVTMTSCCGAGARTNVLNIVKTKGTTVVDRGAFGHVGTTAIRVTGNNVTLKGTETDRLKVFNANRNNAQGSGIMVLSNVNLIEYVDCYLMNLDAPAFAFSGDGASILRYCRAYASDSQGGGPPLRLAGNCSLTVENSTFYSNRTSGSLNPVTVLNQYHTGTASFQNCIFASAGGGQVVLDGEGTYSISHSALPTDAESAESLNATTPYVGTPTVSDLVSESPQFEETIHSITDPYNGAWLRPTNKAAYTGTASTGSNLTGGAAGTALPVSLSGFRVE